MAGFTGIDLAVVIAYLLAITLWGAWLGRGQSTASDYFLGARSLPWPAVLLSVVATETSTLTFLSIPGVAYGGSLVFLQLTVGYALGRVVVAFFLLPAYYRGDLETAYGLLESRFGAGTRRSASGIFMVTRVLADSVRLFATAIPLALVTGWPYPVSIAVIAVLTVIYTYVGGIRAVVWVDAAQMGLYMLGALVACIAIQVLVPGGWQAAMSSASAAGKLQLLDLSWNLSASYTLVAGVLGGAVFAMASHGTDQLIVQRLLTCRTLRDAQKALVGSGIAVAVQFATFLAVGIGVWAFYSGQAFERSDEVFARFIVEQLPPGITGLLIAGVFAAAMSSLSSSINALASATAFDYWAPLAGAVGDERRILRAGKAFTLGWAAILAGGAVLFIPLSRGTSAVEAALGVAAVVYGGLLGAFVLAVLTKRPGSRAVLTGIVSGIAATLAVGDATSWLWHVPIGTVTTVAVGAIVGQLTTDGQRPS